MNLQQREENPEEKRISWEHLALSAHRSTLLRGRHNSQLECGLRLVLSHNLVT